MEKAPIRGVGGREEGSGPQTLDRSDSSDRIVTLHYHGSCSKCHHFHRHVAFDVHLGDEIHTRFRCERCGHPILGLGRTDTQNSLASQDSFPIVNSAVETIPAQSACSNRLDAHPNLQFNTSQLPLVSDPLSAIAEQSSLGESRPISAVSAQAPNVSPNHRASVAEAIANPTARSTVESGIGHQTLESSTRGNSHLRSFLWKCICRIVSNLAHRIGDAQREVRFLGLRLQFQLTSDRPNERHSSSLARARHMIEDIPSSEDAEESIQDACRFPQADGLSARIEEETFSTLVYAQRECANHPSHMEADTTTGNQDQNVALKKERLRIERREKTLKARALQKKCDCADDCHCVQQVIQRARGDSTRFSDNGTLTRSGTSRSFQWVPAFPLGHLARRSSTSSESNPLLAIGARPDPLAHVGEVRFPHWRPSGTTRSASTHDGNRVPEQPSAAASNTSSISLHPDRPIFPGRSFSASLLPLSPSSTGDDFETRDISHTLEFLRNVRAVASGSIPLPWRRSSRFLYNVPFGWPADIDKDSTEPNSPSPRSQSINGVSHPTDQEGRPGVGGLGLTSPDSSLIQEETRENVIGPS